LRPGSPKSAEIGALQTSKMLKLRLQGG